MSGLNGEFPLTILSTVTLNESIAGMNIINRISSHLIDLSKL